MHKPTKALPEDRLQYGYLSFCALTASIGFFFFGYYVGELNNISTLLPCNLLAPGESPDDFIKPFLGLELPQCIPMSTIQFSFVNAIVPLGGVIGSLFFGYLDEKWGRLRSMQLQSITYIVAPLILTFSTTYGWLLAGRFIAGIGNGGSATSIPVYLGEISPPHLRGTVGSLSGTAIAAGLAVSTLMGFVFGHAAPDWRWILALPFAIAVFQAVLFVFCVESPVWLSLRDHDEQERAHVAFRRLGHGPALVKSTIDNRPVTVGNTALTENLNIDIAHTSGSEGPSTVVLQSHETENQHDNALLQPVSIFRFLTHPDHRRSLIILALAHTAQQFCGIDVYFAYSFFILTLVMSSNVANEFYLIFIFVLIPFNYFPGMIADRFGRRPLILGTMGAMAIFSAVLTISIVYQFPMLTLVMFVAAVVIFSVGLSNTPFILVSEVTEPMASSSASIVAQTINTLARFVILFVFPILLDAVGSYTFLFFTGYLVISGVALAIVLPETKDRTGTEIVAEFRRKKSA